MDIVRGLTGSDEGLVPLAARADVALPALSRLLRDPPELSVPAAEALINLSQNPTLADKLVSLGAVPTAMDMLYKNSDQKVARLLIMLLANLTQLDSGSAALVQVLLSSSTNKNPIFSSIVCSLLILRFSPNFD